MALITAYWGMDGIIVLTTFMIAAYLYMTRKFNYWKKRGVTELQPIPFFGNFMDCIFFKKSSGYLLKDFYDRAKGQPYVGVFILDKPALLIRDQKFIKNVLIKDFNYFDNRYSSVYIKDRLGYANLFFIRNPAWKILRPKLTLFFTSGKLKKMCELMLECTKNLDTYLESMKLEGEGKELEMKDLIAKFTTDMIGITAYGLNVNSLNNPEAEFRKCGKTLFENTYIRGFEFIAVFFFPTIVSLLGIRIFKENTVFLRKVFWEVINQRIQSGTKRNDLIDILIELKKTYGDQDFEGIKFDGDDLVAQAAIFFSGGFETSSTAICFILYELAINPEIQDRVRKEILDALENSDGDDKITYDMIMLLPYLDMVVSEGLRKYPPLPFLDRVATNTYEMPDSNLIVEKNTPIYISILGMHYDPEHFPDPVKFDPERFNEENKHKIPTGVYLPFGDGPRICIGARLGRLQTKLGLIKILSKYEVSPSEKTLIPMVFDSRGVMSMPLNGGLYINIRKLNT